MSPLWIGTIKTKYEQLLTILKRPSSKHNNHNLKFFPKKPYFPNHEFPVCVGRPRFIEGISLLIARQQGMDKMPMARASMTVEAAIVLPMFLLFFLSLSSLFEMIRLHTNLDMALWYTGKTVSVYGSAFEMAETDGIVSEVTDMVITHTYVRETLVQYLGEDYLEESPLKKGTQSLWFPEGDLVDPEGHVEITVTYQVALWGGLTEILGSRLINRYYGHLWTGYKIPGADADPQDREYVFLAEEGVVFHLSENCSYLNLSVREVSLQGALDARNTDGKKYGPCERCYLYGGEGNVFITDGGESYHANRECPGLKRKVNKILKKDAEGYAICTRCGVE